MTSSTDPSDWADLHISAAPMATGRIVFESNRDGDLEIYSMDPDGSSVTALTENEITDDLPAISPDGTRVAFTSDRLGSNDIWVMNIDGTGRHAAHERPGERPPAGLVARRDEDRLREQRGHLHHEADGTEPGNVTNSSAIESGVTWSPDGTQIAYRLGRRRRHPGHLPAERRGFSIADRPDERPDARLRSRLVARRGQDRVLQRPRAERDRLGLDDGRGRRREPVNVTNATIYDADPAWSPDGTRIAFVRDAGGQNFKVWTALADGTEQVNLTPHRRAELLPRLGADPDGTDVCRDLDLGAGELGPGRRLGGDRGHLARRDPRRDGTTAGAPLGGIPLGGIPLGGIPLGGIPLGGIPLGGIGFTAADLNENGLGGVPLSTIPFLPPVDPLQPPDTWEAHLALDPAFAGTPPQNVTLAQVLGTAVVAGVTLDDLNLASSPLGGIPLAGIALGGLPLGGIPLGGIAGSTEDENEAAWCDYVNDQPGFTCPGDVDTDGETMLGLALHGVPLGGIPLGGIPLGGIPLGGIPLGGIAVGTPLGGIPLGGINLVGTPLGGIPLGGIDMSVSPLGGITLGVIPQKRRTRSSTARPGTSCAPTPTRSPRRKRPARSRRAQSSRTSATTRTRTETTSRSRSSSSACRPRRRSKTCSPPSS